MPLMPTDDEEQKYGGLLGGAGATLRPDTTPQPGMAGSAWEWMKAHLGGGNPGTSPSQNMIMNGPATPQAPQTPQLGDPALTGPATGVTGSWDAPPPPPEKEGFEMPATPQAPAVSHDDMLAMFKQSGNDNAARLAQEQAGDRTKMLGIIPAALGGIGDAVSGNAAGKTQDEITNRIDTEVDKKKAEVDEKLKNDPNSDISKQYQATAYKAFQMLGANPKPEDLAKMSAAQIAAQMPNIDKLSAIQTTKDTREDALRAHSQDMALKLKELALMKEKNGIDKGNDTIRKYQDAFNKAKGVVSANGVLDKLSTAKGLLNSASGVNNNEVAKQALSTALAYVATGGMRVNQIEIGQFTHGQSLTNRVADWMQKISNNQLTDRDAHDMQGVIAAYEKGATGTLKKYQDHYAQQLSAGQRMDPKEARTRLGFDAEIPQPQSGVPEVGSTFQGGKVTKVTRIK